MNRRSFLQALGFASAGAVAGFTVTPAAKPKGSGSFVNILPPAHAMRGNYEAVTWTEIGEVSELQESLDCDVMAFTPLSESRGPGLRGRIS